MSDIFLLVFFILLIMFLASLEAAIISLNPSRIKILAESEDSNAIILKKFLDTSKKSLASLQIFSMIFIIVYSLIVYNFFIVYMMDLEISSSLYNVFTVLTIVFSGYILAIFGKFIPRMFGLKKSEKYVIKFIKVIETIRHIMFPLVLIANVISNNFVKLFGIKASELDDVITEEEIRLMVDAGADNGTIDESEIEMINNIFEFDDTDVFEIATHRMDIVGVSIDTDIFEIINIINTEQYSRLPVYNENIDDIIGFFHVKDLLKNIFKDNKIDIEKFDIKDILFEPYFVPLSKKIDVLFEEMQTNKVHMAIVIDEYGGTSGIVTMEDLLEEIVGNIFDEHDKEEMEDIVLVKENIYDMKGSTHIDDVNEILGISLDEEDYDTLGGYLIGELGRIPEDGENLSIVIGDYNFTIEKVLEKRIEKIRVTYNELNHFDCPSDDNFEDFAI